jgi:SAM-dependent methyltransferase
VLNKCDLRCPCPLRERLVNSGGVYYCNSDDCTHAVEHKGFSSIDGKPILINFSRCDTVCEPENFMLAIGEKPEDDRRRAYMLFRKIFYGENELTTRNCERFLTEILENNSEPRVLIIGSGTIGQGSGLLYGDSRVSITGIDIYSSTTVDAISDAHYLPFRDGAFDGVWIQAVLEHVVDPTLVAAEIHRVLKKDGVVYSEAPFIQQVHEGANDFFRFTVSGHRFVFKNFVTLDIGILSGAATSFVWSLRHLLVSVIRNKAVAISLTAPFFFLARLFESFFKYSSNWDGACATYFLGRKDEYKCSHRELIQLYEQRGFR